MINTSNLITAVKGIAMTAVKSDIFKYDFDYRLSKQVLGMQFLSPVCIAGGFDKNATHLGSVANMGAGSIEVGTVTPLPQSKRSDVKKHVKINIWDKSLINWIGCANDGIDAVAQRLSGFWSKNLDSKNRIIIGVNIGFNNTATDRLADYLTCAKRIKDCSDYVTINLSSPNVEGMRELQNPQFVDSALSGVANVLGHNRIFIKISPELDIDVIGEIANIIRKGDYGGIVAFNTFKHFAYGSYGGLSGVPIFTKSLNRFKEIQKKCKGIVTIASGGIYSGHDAQKYLNSGASLVQVYSMLAFRGLLGIRKINNEILSCNKDS